MYRLILAATLLAGCAHPGGPSVPRMVRVAPGQFVAGSSPAETTAAGYPAEYAAREQPARVVTVARAFAIGRTEVTRGQYARFVAATGRKSDRPCSYLADGPANRWDTDRDHDWRNPGFVQTDAHPVVCVSHADARAYAAWLSERTGRRFRLPSNTEWEYAARAGTTAPRWWGAGNDCERANLSDASRARAHNRGVVDPATYFACDDGHVFTAPVASFGANPWGLHDMLGNVWEWTLDCLHATQAGASGDTTPRTDGDCTSRIDRGASWTNSPKYVRAAVQHPDLADARTTVLGFRLVEDLPDARSGSR